MVVRLFNPSRWALLSGAFVVLGSEPHRVVVDVNAETDARFDVVTADGQAIFLATVKGMERLEFTAGPGDQLVATSEGEVWYFTDEGDSIAVETFGESFTRIATRRERNPQLEMMEFKMRENERRMQAKLDAAMAVLAEARAADAVKAGADPETGEVVEDPADGTDVDTGAVGEAGGGNGEEPKLVAAVAKKGKRVSADGNATA